MKHLLLILAIALGGCAGVPDADGPTATPTPAQGSGAVLVDQPFMVLDAAIRPVAQATVRVGDDEAQTDDAGRATLRLDVGTHAWSVDAPGFLPASGTFQVRATPEPLRAIVQPLPPDWMAPQTFAYSTYVACSINAMVPFGHACGLIDDGDAEGNWQFTMEPDAPARSTWRITYAADQPGNYLIQVVTPSTGTAGTGGGVIAELRIDDAASGQWELMDGEVGPHGVEALDVSQGAKLVIFVKGDVASPEPLQGTPAGHGVGVRLDHEGQLFIQQWDPRGRAPEPFLA